MLYGVAAIMIGLAAVLYGVSALLKALGIRVKEPERALTPEEKRAIEASIKASEKGEHAMDALVFGAPQGGDGL